jgi:hypothetical protein
MVSHQESLSPRRGGNRGVSCKRRLIGFLVLLFFVSAAKAQTPQLALRPIYPSGGDSDPSSRLEYSITPVESVKAAWIEVWDRPKLLARQAVPVQTRGQIPIPDYEETELPSALKIAINDPEVLNYCIDNCAEVPAPGRQVSEMVIGVSDPDYWDEPDLSSGSAQRVAIPASWPELTVTGHRLSPRTHLLLLQEESEGDRIVQRFRASLATDYLDFCSVHVAVPSSELLEPGVFALYAVDNDSDSTTEEQLQRGMFGREQRVYVVKQDSPEIDRIEAMSADTPASQAVLTVWGRNFTPHLSVHFGRDPMEMGGDQVEFISPTQVRVHLEQDALTDGNYAGPPHTLWLVDDDDNARISSPIDFHAEPTAAHKAYPVPASICSVEPYPFDPLPQTAPRWVKLTVKGNSFRPDDTVIVKGGSTDEDTTLKTTYVSPEQLETWFPRDLWRVHSITFRLVVEIGSQLYAAEAADTP